MSKSSKDGPKENQPPPTRGSTTRKGDSTGAGKAPPKNTSGQKGK